jgi:hypothetical protein
LSIDQDLHKTRYVLSGRPSLARPRLKYTDSGFDGLGFGEHDLNRGRPRRAAPTVHSTVRLDIWTTRRRRRIRG